MYVCERMPKRSGSGGCCWRAKNSLLFAHLSSPRLIPFSSFRVWLLLESKKQVSSSFIFGQQKRGLNSWLWCDVPVSPLGVVGGCLCKTPKKYEVHVARTPPKTNQNETPVIRLCIVCVRLCTHFFRLCTITAKVTAKKPKVGQWGSGDMHTPPSLFLTENGANRLCTFVYTFFSFVWKHFPLQGAGTSIEGENSKWSNFHKNGANRLCTFVYTFFSFVWQPFPFQGGWNIYRG